MGYWIFLILILIVLSAVIFVSWYCNTKCLYEDICGISIFLICILSCLVIYLGMDIPNALAGGDKVYVDSFPSVAQGQSMQYIFADGHSYVSFHRYYPDDYEQNAQYCIRYTKFTKIVLSIENIEKSTD